MTGLFSELSSFDALKDLLKIFITISSEGHDYWTHVTHTKTIEEIYTHITGLVST